MSRKSRSQRRAILSATSALAIIVGLGGNAWACSPTSGTFAFFTNTGSVDCFNFNNATVTGNLSNTSTGTIGPPSSPAPGSLVVNSSTIGGSLSNSGQINASGGTPNGIVVTGGSVVGGGIINNSTGTINVNASGPSAAGIKVSQSSYSGGITNSGVIVVNNSSGSAVGISVTGGVSPPPPPPLAPIIKTTSNTSTTNNTGTNYTLFGGKHRH
ncbi:MAG TPA: hypothetical protein VJN67_24645 [Stellaceae bacterium]|nr:hypothetical protein [Stellaceae bacterium]